MFLMPANKLHFYEIMEHHYWVLMGTAKDAKTFNERSSRHRHYLELINALKN